MWWIFQTPLSRYLIGPLSRIYSISLDTYRVPEGGFLSLNQFFIREKKPELLSFPLRHLGSPVDGCIELFRDITVTDDFVVKWYHANLLKLFWPDIADFIWGDVCFCRLRFSDYHRFHFFDDGEVLSSISREGPLYSVDNRVLNTGLWIHNKSHLMRLRTANFWDILCLEVGATNVGSITNHKKVGEKFSRWEEKWYFELGGSAVLLVFQKGMIQWSSSLIEKTLQKEEYEVMTGQVIGTMGKQ
jgi:phosphatidylserine decarboxylase